MARLHPAKLARRLAWSTERALAHHDSRERAAARAEVERITKILAAADRCRNCGRALRDPHSVELGIGPECRARLAAAEVAS